MTRKSSRNRLQMSRYKLDALLDITQSINANLPAEELLKKYESILREELEYREDIYSFQGRKQMDMPAERRLP